MKYEITLPVLSDTMSAGKLVRWLKQPGDQINKGDVIAEIESDKAIMEVEAFHSGYLAGPLAPVNTDLPVKQVIGYIVDEPERAAQSETSTSQPEASDNQNTHQPTVETVKPVAKAPQHEEVTSPPPQEPLPKVATHASGTPVASPHARALALQYGIDLSHVSPGEDGRILANDVLAAVHNSKPVLNLEAGPPYRLQKLTSMQEAIANNMTATLATPTFRTTARIDLEGLKKVARQQQLSLTLLLASACAKAVKSHPQFNAVYTPEGMAHRDRVDVGIAVDVPGGLITPVLRDVAERPLDELGEDWRILKDKIKRQRITQEEYQGATFYLSNLGVFPVVHSFDALVPLGAAAILAIGAEHDGYCLFTLSCDHRVVSGADSARFLTSLQDHLQKPEALLI